MARGVDDVDAGAAILDGAILGEDGDAALALQVVRVHHALANAFVCGEGAGLLQQAVDQRGLAVVDMRDDRDVADGAGGAHGGDIRTEPGPGRAARGGQKGRAAYQSPALCGDLVGAPGTAGRYRGVQGGAITGILRPRATPDPESLQNFYIRVF